MIFGLSDFLLVLAFLISLIFLYFWNKHQYYKRLGINHLKPDPIFGNTLMSMLGKEHTLTIGENIYKQFPDDKYVGVYNFQQPIVMVKDLEIVKLVMVKDFENFVDHMKFTDEEVDPMLGKSLFSLEGDRWREMRATLSPAFTSSKMRGMLPLMEECMSSFVEFLNKELDDPSTKKLGYKEYDIKDLMGHLANDVIASCAFGFKLNSLQDDKKDFYTLAKDFTTFTTLDNVKFFVYFFLPSITRLFKIQTRSKTTTDFFRNLVMGTIKMREEQKITRLDMIHLLMLAKQGSLQTDGVQDEDDNLDQSKQKPKKTKWTEDDLTAQALIFLFAGLDSTSNAISALFHRLAITPEVQEKLREEIDEFVAKSNGKFDYSELNKMKYLDMVISESLRLWPPVPVLDRTCVRQCTLPPQNEYGGKSLKCHKGDVVWIPSFVIQRDPKNFSDPEEFIPERFSDENKSNIDPYSYMPFGLGPRQCIGSRFALMEIKIVTVIVLQHFELIVTPKTDTNKYLKPKPHFFELLPEKGFWAGIKKRDKK